MIPDHLIDKAAAAIYASSVFGDRFALDAWHDMNDNNPIKTTTRMYARAALDTVAADIWDEAYRCGVDDARIADDLRVDVGLGPDLYAQPARQNPYRASEDA